MKAPARINFHSIQSPPSLPKKSLDRRVAAGIDQQILNEDSMNDLASIPRPDRISPWEIKPLMASVPTLIQPVAEKYKRPKRHSEAPYFRDAIVGDSTYWKVGLTKSDVTQVINVMSENIGSDDMRLWHHKQTNNSSNNGISRNLTDGCWLYSPHSSGPYHLCQDATDDSKSVAVSTWPLHVEASDDDPLVKCVASQFKSCKNDIVVELMITLKRVRRMDFAKVMS